MLPSKFFPTVSENRLKYVQDFALTRSKFIGKKPNNLFRLLHQRFDWMNSYIHENDRVIELGTGHGLSKYFIKHNNYVISDVEMNPWVDIKLDVLNLPLEKIGFDVIICSHMIHHIAKPSVFFRDVQRILKPGGLILIQEINTSFLMKLLIFFFRHEGWSYDVDVFDDNVIANDPRDSWSANCAIPELLFSDTKFFESKFPEFSVEKNTFNECFLFPLSGGIAATVAVPSLPNVLLDMVQLLDKALVRLAPGIFALGRTVVLRKKN